MIGATIDTQALVAALEALTGQMTVYPRGYVVRFDQAANEWCALRCTDTGLAGHPDATAPHGYAASASAIPLTAERVGGWPSKAQACEAVERLLASAALIEARDDDDQDVISAMLSEGSPVVWANAGGAQ